MSDEFEAWAAERGLPRRPPLLSNGMAWTWLARKAWRVAAYKLLVEYAKTYPAPTLMTEDVIEWAHGQGGLPEPPDRRSWGAVILAAKRARLLTFEGYAAHKDPSRHGAPSAVWRINR